MTKESENKESQKSAPQVTCPACSKVSKYSTENEFRPFCSERCKVIDLGAWASEQYRIAGSNDNKTSEGSDNTQ